MKAAVHTRYGPPEVVRVVEVDKPVATDTGVQMVRYFKELIETGQFRPVIGRRYPLDQIVEAYR